MKTLTSIIDYLEHCGGAEMFSFYKKNDKEEYLFDRNGKKIPDVEGAYRFGISLKEQLAELIQDESVEVYISTNIVRVRLLNFALI